MSRVRRHRSSRHDVYATIDINRSARKPAGVRRGEVGAGETNVQDVDQLSDRRSLRGLVEQQIEVLETRSGAGLERPGRDRVHSYALAAQLVGEIAAGCLEGRLHR